MTPEHPTVYIIDDDISVRDALRNLLRSVGLRIETFGSAQEFLASPRSNSPACLVLDVRLPGLSGLDLQRKLIEAKVEIPIIFITAHGDIQMSVRAMKSGAVEFLTKPFRDQDLLDAVQEAIAGDRAARTQREESEELRERYESLSTREQEVLALVAEGFVNKEIGGQLAISEATVKLHRSRAMQKMHAHSLAELIKMAERLAISSKGNASPSST
jgi:FixJ family two-component response regulator